MRTFIATALIATMAAAESDIFLKEELLVRHLATGSKVEATANRPNASARTEVDCIALNPTGSQYYDYEWNTEGCFCSHIWNQDAPYVTNYWANCDLTDGEILNPYHETNNSHDRCLTQEEYDACADFDSCVVLPPTPPTPPIEECNVAFGNADAEPTGYASAYIQHNDHTTEPNMYEGSGFESGWVTFNESCGMGSMCGVDYCIGTCVEGEIWGLRNESGLGTEKFGISIHEFGVLDNSDSQTGETGVCGQTGTVWNPEELAHGIPTDAIYPPGALGNVDLSVFLPAFPAAPSQC